MKAACFSVAAMDFYPQQNKYYPGGNSLNQAIRFRQLGYESAFIGALGTDQAGDQIEALFKSNAVDSSHLYRIQGQTANNQLVVDAVGERLGLDGAWEGGVYEIFALAEADWNFLSRFDVWSTHANNPNYLMALKRKQNTQLMSVDFLHWKDYELLEKSLRVIDIAYFGGTADMADDLAQIAKKNPGIIVLTLGAEGSIAFQGTNIHIRPALPIEKVVDTTGSGDALLAGAELGRKAAGQFGGTPWE